MNKTEALQYLDSQQDFLFHTSDSIWDNPETDYHEEKSSAILKNALTEAGFTVQSGLAGIPTAFSGSYGSGKPVIGFLGEFDALSGLSQEAGITEKKPIAEGGNGHGCGHNLLGTGSLAAAIAVKKYLEASGKPGTVIFFGCPAEEGGSGKAFMAKAGVSDGGDIALSWHPNNLNSVWSFSTLANVRVHYSFKGVSAHAGTSPHLGRSALDALELMNMGVQFLREHIIPEARIHYAITNTGGTAPNVVQAEAESVYLIRAPKNSQVQEIYERVNQIAKGAAMMCGVEVTIELEKACSNVLVNRCLEKVLYENMKAVELPEYSEEEYSFAKALQDTMPQRTLLADRFERLMGEKGRQIGAEYDKKSINRFIIPYHPSEKPVSGSSDVGDVSWVCPTSQIVAVTCAGGTPEHTWQMVAQGKSSIAHKGLLYAGKVLAGAAIDLLEQPELIQEATEEFKRKTGPEGYQPLLPPEAQPKID